MKIVFFPGFPKCLSLLNEFIEEFQEKIGYVYQAKRFDQDVEAGNGKMYTLIAYSAGAIGAVSFAKKYPKRIEKIILINPAGLPKPRGVIFYRIDFLLELIKLPKDERVVVKKELEKDREATAATTRKIVDFDLAKEIPADLASRVCIIKSLSDSMFPPERVKQHFKEEICLLGNGHFYLTQNAEVYVEKIKEII
ncbi:MAG: alpha/beta hydrolase [Candidatus Moraniibacteriota bacterium]